MPRAPKSAAACLALVIATAGIGATALTVSSPAPTATIGSMTPVTVTYSGGSNQTVYLFGGTEHGMTVVSAGGTNVTIPIAGLVFSAATGTMKFGVSQLGAGIPDASELIGEKLIWVAVVVDGASGRILSIAKSGGPIIEDAIC
jgi:hypothetical protein